MSTTTQTEKTVADLRRALSMEIESVLNYLALSINLDGVLAEEIKRALGDDVEEELGHAKKLAQRIKELGALVPGSADLDLTTSALRPTSTPTTDLEAVIRGVLADENAAIEHYRNIIQETDGVDYVTQDLCITLLADEEKHRTLFESFLREFEHI